MLQIMGFWFPPEEDPRDFFLMYIIWGQIHFSWVKIYFTLFFAVKGPPQINTVRAFMFLFLLEFCEAMEGSSSNNVENIFLPAHDPNELRNRQNELEKKEARIQELKKQIELTKLHLEEMKKKSGAKEKMEAFNHLVEAYNRMREEYNAWLAERSRDSNK
ncbi:unnamed protein product [Prunus brigantina]